MHVCTLHIPLLAGFSQHSCTLKSRWRMSSGWGHAAMSPGGGKRLVCRLPGPLCTFPNGFGVGGLGVGRGSRHVGVSVRSVPQSQLFVFTRNWFVKQVRPDGWLESQRVAVRRSLGEVRTPNSNIGVDQRNVRLG